MRKILYTCYYRCKQPERQVELDRCLVINLNHPGLDKVVVLREDNAPPFQKGSVPCEVIDHNQRLTYSHWLTLAKQEHNAIALLVNSDIYLAQGLEYFDAVFDKPDAFLALSRYDPEPNRQRLRLHDNPHWSQDTWGIRTDAEISQSLLCSSTFSQGLPGCDNRIAHVLWSHGFAVKNPCYFVKSVHEHKETYREYDKIADRLYGSVCYVCPSLNPGETSELQHTLWTRSTDICSGIAVTQSAIGKGQHHLVAETKIDRDRFHHLRKFSGLMWMHQALGSAQVKIASPHTLAESQWHASNHSVGLPMQELTSNGVVLELPDDIPLMAFSLRLPHHSASSYGIAVKAGEGQEMELNLLEEEARIEGQGRRNFFEGARIQGTFTKLSLWLRPLDNENEIWSANDLAELVLFGEKSAAPESTKKDVVKPANAPIVAVAKVPFTAPDWGQYTVIARQEFKEEDKESVKCFGDRFEVLSDGEALYFVDRFWPTVGRVVFQGTAKAALTHGEEALFAVGFLQPLLEWMPDQIASEKKHKDHLLFWQYPCRTEEDAYRVHQGLKGPHLEEQAYQVYVGLPWATFIDRGVNKQLDGSPYPEALLLDHHNRANALAEVLTQWGKTLQVHSVCQHIFWREASRWIRSAGVTDLWISHKEKGLDEIHDGLRLHSWILYAVNDRDPARREGLSFVPIEQRPVFASFIGAQMKHYISDVHQRIAKLTGLKDYQMFGVESKKDVSETEEVRTYNELLSHTQFSLCPSGAGPNTLRLWESLAVGAIPVVLSDRHQLPDLERLLPGESLSWDQVVVLHPEDELDQLDFRLRAFETAERHRRQRLCRRVYEASIAMTCFGHSTREADPIPLLQELFKPQQVQIPGQTKAEFTGVSHLVPAALPLSNEGPSSIVVHLDQTEQLLGFRLTGLNCTINQLNLTISRCLVFNKFEELTLDLDSQGGDGASLWLPKGKRWWAMGAKLTAEWKQPPGALTTAELRLAVWSEKDAFAREAQRLDRAGILKAASDRNAERQDITFHTKNIDSGAILDVLPKVVRNEDLKMGNQLLPSISAPKTNLIGETMLGGITMYVHLMNRNENIKKNLPNWLEQKCHELILVDWSSSNPVADIPGVFDDKRVRVLRVDEQSSFIRTLAQNLASRMARNHRIFKFDSDVEFKGDLFTNHPLEPGEFWTGKWQQARDNNERHLNGEIFYCIQDFLAVGGYDERIKSYGQDDTNLKDRMLLSGIAMKVFDYNCMHHQHHSQKSRVQPGQSVHPMIATFANRMMTTKTPLWTSESEHAIYTIDRCNDQNLRFKLLSAARNATTEAHIIDATNEIIRWYCSEEKIKTMSREEINAIIWERQIE
ncbi:MAG: exostosin family protein [Cyanobium sp.]